MGSHRGAPAARQPRREDLCAAAEASLPAGAPAGGRFPELCPKIWAVPASVRPGVRRAAAGLAAVAETCRGLNREHLRGPSERKGLKDAARGK